MLSYYWIMFKIWRFLEIMKNFEVCRMISLKKKNLAPQGYYCSIWCQKSPDFFFRIFKWYPRVPHPPQFWSRANFIGSLERYWWVDLRKWTICLKQILITAPWTKNLWNFDMLVIFLAKTVKNTYCHEYASTIRIVSGWKK